MISRLGIFFIFAIALPARAEKIEYEIYNLDDDRQIIKLASGTKEYDDSDFQIIEKESSSGEKYWSKMLMLPDGFGIGASIYRESEVSGFGLWAKKSGCGFSWEWFNRSGPDTYIKLQESGEVSVTYRIFQDVREISEIRFDSDISLRLNESRDLKRNTHRILIKKGSVLKFPLHNTFQNIKAQ